MCRMNEKTEPTQVEFLNGAQLAQILGVHRDTIARWYKKGRIKGATQFMKGSPIRIPIATAHEMAGNLGITIDAADLIAE